MTFWLMLISGLVGGRVFFYSRRSTKLFYLLALACLITLLLLYVMPKVVPGGFAAGAQIMPLIRIGIPVLIVVMALLPESIEAESAREAIDLAYSVFIMLMLAVVAVGSVAYMLLERIDYAQALLVSVFAMAAMLLVASWLWKPGAGFSGLGAVTSRYMLSIGLPFEQWLRSLADLAQRESDPERFLDSACQGMVEQLPWVSSCTWVDGNRASAKLIPITGKHGLQTEFSEGELVLTMTTQQPIPPVMVWHFNLVVQLVARFYVEKKRDRQLREMAYMQAVHETGARVTHDVKNLLQSLHALLFVIGETGEESNERAQPLLRRQLPLITERLQQTLEKLKVPDSGLKDTVAADAWWRDLRSRYDTRAVRFESFGDMKKELPASLFTSAAENLLQNAFDKRAGEVEIDITVTLDLRDSMPVLAVSDSGSPLPATKASDIGKRPVASENGLGIGLYQLSRIAAMTNYGLELSANHAGEVCFRLAPKMQA